MRRFEGIANCLSVLLLLGTSGCAAKSALAPGDTVGATSADPTRESRELGTRDIASHEEAPAADDAYALGGAPEPAPAAEAPMTTSSDAEAARAAPPSVHPAPKMARKEAGGAIAANPEFDTEAYASIEEHDFVAVADDARSTFSVDVDTASYSNVRRFLRDGQLPPAGAVRIEELINYFDYDYAQPRGPEPFSITTEVGPCPWNPKHRLVHVGLQGKLPTAIPPRNLVFLLDVSGSMADPDKLPLVKHGLTMLAEQMRPEDRVSIVVYAGASGVVLEPTANKRKIIDALERLESGGSTNGAQGIELAYAMAARHFRADGINRVILATDGDFNVGVTSHDELVRLIERKRETGVFLSVLGFGTGNLQDSTMEQIADHGNGNYAYIDTASEAHKVLVQESGATLVTIAKDVKIQVEWNPTEVAAYRLVGYENRKLDHADFNDDRKDAGEIGAGHSVTALYEVVPADGLHHGKTDPLKYQRSTALTQAAGSGELMTIALRYKQPKAARSTKLTTVVRDDERELAKTSRDFRFSAAVAGFGMLLRDSKYTGSSTWSGVRALASEALGRDPHGHRREFLQLVDLASRLQGDHRSARVAK